MPLQEFCIAADKFDRQLFHKPDLDVKPHVIRYLFIPMDSISTMP